LGDTAAALASYAKAAQILTPLSSAPGDNREAQRYLSLALQNIGRVQIRNGDWARALENERKAVALAEPLAQAAPGNDQYHSLLADNYLHLGAALYQAGRSPRTAEYAEAINSFRKALAIHLRLVEKHPDKAEYRYATGVDYEYIGIAYNFLGDLTGDAENYQRALENHIKELEINEALVASDPTNEAYRRIRADAYGEAGLSQLKLGLAAEALANFRKKLAIFESIEASDPTNVEARRDVANARREVAQALAAGGEIAGGLEQAAKACAALEALRVTEPDTAETLFYLIDAYNETGELQKRMSNYDAATGVYANALRLLDEWNKKEPASAVGHRLFAVTHFNLAVLHETVAQTAPSSAAKMNWNNARDCYERSLRLWQQLPDDKLSSRDRARITEIRGHLARCERALSQL
jgi:tetratricopeptide (TPR) repeat protein